MARQRTFLLGMLVGVLLGSAAGYLLGTSRTQPAATPGVILPGRPVMASPDPRFQPLPPGWRQHEFNGRPFYIIPLAARG